MAAQIFFCFFESIKIYLVKEKGNALRLAKYAGFEKLYFQF